MKILKRKGILASFLILLALMLLPSYSHCSSTEEFGSFLERDCGETMILRLEGDEKEILAEYIKNNFDLVNSMAEKNPLEPFHLVAIALTIVIFIGSMIIVHVTGKDKVLFVTIMAMFACFSCFLL